MNNLLTAIYSKVSNSNFSSDIGGRFYLDDAPQDVEFPYSVYFIVSAVPNDTFTEFLDDVLVQFSIFSASEGAAEITGIYNNLIALFDNCSLTITSDTHIWMDRQNLMTMIEEVVTPAGTTKVKHWAVDYSIMIQRG